MRIKLHILVSTILAISAVALVGGVGLYSLMKINTEYNYAVDYNVKKIILGARLNQDLLSYSRAEKNYQLSVTEAEQNIYLNRAKSFHDAIQSKVKDLKVLVDDSGQLLLQKFEQEWKTYLSLEGQNKDFLREGQDKSSEALSKAKAIAAFDKAQEHIAEIVNRNEADLFLDKMKTDKIYHIAIKWFVSLAVFILLIITFIGLEVRKRIVRGLDDINRNFKSIAHGDFRLIVGTKQKDEIGEILRDLSRISKKHTQVLSETDELYKDAKRILESLEEVNQTENQKRKVKELASSIKTRLSSLKQILKH